MRAALEAQFAGAGLGAPIVIMESMSFQTNAELAQRLNCLFVASRYDLTALNAGALCALGMALPGVAQRVGALYAAPCSMAIGTLLDAMKAAAPEIGIAAGAMVRRGSTRMQLKSETRTPPKDDRPGDDCAPRTRAGT